MSTTAMKICGSIAELRGQVSVWRGAGERVAFVPTMGNLHHGHITLVKRAMSVADRVVVSIFVNPLQFGPNEDFLAYPRTEQRDAAMLADAGADLLFLPSEAEIYPHGRDCVTRIEVPGISDLLCGASRPGHFIGVATVVAKLFNIVQPDIALFGEKDFQQLIVIRRMVEELNFPFEISGVPTVRESDGLAMSSRNGYLSANERAIAPTLFTVLTEVKRRIVAGGDRSVVEDEAVKMLVDAGFVPDYVAVRRRADLSIPSEVDRELVVLAAARLGHTRLIDNLAITLEARG